MLVEDVVDGVSERFLLLSCGWLAGRQLEKNPLNKMYSTVLLPPVYNNNTQKIKPSRSSRMDGVVVIHLTSTQQAAALHICIPYL